MLAKLDMEKPLRCKKRARRVFFICSGMRGSEWSAKIGKDVSLNSSKLDRVTQAFSKALKTSANHNAILYVCSEEALDINQREDEVDLLVFPDHIRVRNANVDQFSQLLAGKIDQSQSAPIPQKHVLFVCTHSKRDNRCGKAGILTFNALVDQAEQDDNILVSEQSHVGGHAFAGNVLAFPGGDLFGRVRPCHAHLLIEQYCRNGMAPSPEIYRGQLLVVDDNELF